MLFFKSLLASALFALPLSLTGIVSTQSSAIAQAAHQDDHEHAVEHFFVGLDIQEILTRGDYIGLSNPNYNRLTFLTPHVNTEDPTSSHFHGLGSYSYIGAVENPTVLSTSTNNRIPETYSEQPPLTLVPGTGLFDGLLISMATDLPYSDLGIAPVQSIQTLDENLFGSSDGRWTGSLADAAIALELVSITPGLHVADQSATNIFANVGDRYVIGEGNDFEEFMPTFWTDAAAPVGNYSATFKLQDISIRENRLGESGTFTADFQVASVPEPSVSLGLGLLGLVAIAKRRKRPHQAT
ncbi:all3515 family Zur-repressed PEP-CTERM protein [Leptolyngbya sp. BC1307]|uniref:all3515 family Zur-repressed PEP-CTERM protein n=1 Tax=Leptolyngbya sp. BC1307 TaxID=2029589 RepID=UPI000EFB7455|nr:all3515 family Zur-repressed PEP-CTERM protein [Leptolyngbya sp. BC1307]